MANHSLTVRVINDGDTTSLMLGASINIDAMAPGDTLTVNAIFEGSQLGTVGVGGFSPYFTNTSDLTLSAGQSAVKTIKTSGFTPPVSGQLWAYRSGYITQYQNFRITSSNDSVPDPFYLGRVNDAERDHAYASNTITVRGINVATTATVSGGGATLRLNGGSVAYTSVSVVSGDRLQVVLTSSSYFNTAISSTLNIGGTTDSFTVVTWAGPGSGVRIPWPYGSAISLLKIRSFFVGDNAVGFKNLSDFVRDGAAVPDVVENANISRTASGLRMSQFANAVHSLYLEKQAGNQAESVLTTGAAKTVNLAWFVNGIGPHDPRFGYGSLLDALEYRYVLSPTEGEAYLSVGSGSYGPNNKSVIVTATAAANVESRHAGTITGYARHKLYPSIELSFTASYHINFKGP